MKHYESKAFRQTIGYGIIGFFLIVFAGFVFYAGSIMTKQRLYYILFGSVSLIAGLWCVFPMIPGSTTREMKRILKQKGISKDTLDQDLSAGISMKFADFGIRYAVAYGERKSTLLGLEDMVWIYGGITDVRHKLYGVVALGTGTNFTVTMIDRNNVETKVVMETKEKQKVGLSAIIVLFLVIVVLVMVNDESFQSDDPSSKILLLGGVFLMAAFFIGFSVFVAKRRDLFVGIYYLYDAQGIEFHQRKKEVYRRNWDYFKRFEIQGNGTIFRLYDQDMKLVINGTTRWTGSRDFMAFAVQRMKELQ